MRLENKVQIMTGAAQGMGEATAERFAAEGAHVYLTDVNAELGQAVAAKLGKRVHFEPLDVTDEANWASLGGKVLAVHDKIDGLINNAGIHFNSLIENTMLADLRKLLDIDMIGPWLGMRAVAPHMKAARRGSIVNISSVEGLTGFCGSTAYSAAKWGLRAMTKSLAKEVGPFGVRVNTVNPGAIDTPMLRHGMGDQPFGSVFPDVALNRPERAEEIATATLFLVSDDSTYVSGADLTVDGGWTCGAYLMDKPFLNPA